MTLALESTLRTLLAGCPCPCCSRPCADHPNDGCLFSTAEEALAELDAMVERRLNGERE